MSERLTGEINRLTSDDTQIIFSSYGPVFRIHVIKINKSKVIAIRTDQLYILEIAGSALQVHTDHKSTEISGPLPEFTVQELFKLTSDALTEALRRQFNQVVVEL